MAIKANCSYRYQNDQQYCKQTICQVQPVRAEIYCPAIRLVTDVYSHDLLVAIPEIYKFPTVTRVGGALILNHEATYSIKDKLSHFVCFNIYISDQFILNPQRELLSDICLTNCSLLGRRGLSKIGYAGNQRALSIYEDDARKYRQKLMIALSITARAARYLFSDSC